MNNEKTSLLLMLKINTYRNLIILLLGLFISLSSIAQKEAYNWYFGDRTGITFHTQPPTEVNGTNISH